MKEYTVIINSGTAFYLIIYKWQHHRRFRKKRKWVQWFWKWLTKCLQWQVKAVAIPICDIYQIHISFILKETNQTQVTVNRDEWNKLHRSEDLMRLSCNCTVTKFAHVDMLRFIVVASMLFYSPFFSDPCSFIWSSDQFWPVKCEQHIHLPLPVLSSFLRIYLVWCSVHREYWICEI